MGTSHNTAQLVRKIDTYATSIGKANRAGTSAAALRYKEQALRNVTADTGGDRIMSNFRNGNVRMGVGYQLKGTTNALAIVRPRPYGVWALLDGGSKPHIVRPRARGRSGGRRRALTIGNGFAAYANLDRGSKGKRTFRRTPAQAKTAAVRSFHRSHHQALLDVFK